MYELCRHIMPSNKPAPEQHHADCKCGLCEPIEECHPVEGPLVCEPATAMGAPSLEPVATKVGNHESSPSDQQPSVAKRKASAHALRSPVILDPIQKEPNYDHYIYGDEIAKQKPSMPRACAPRSNPDSSHPKHKPWDKTTYERPSARSYREWREGSTAVAKNQSTSGTRSIRISPKSSNPSSPGPKNTTSNSHR
jgi:hypothetical protein